ncbi:hypothetical protein ZWY2020_049501, partial [Hordeum vulgare]
KTRIDVVALSKHAHVQGKRQYVCREPGCGKGSCKSFRWHKFGSLLLFSFPNAQPKLATFLFMNLLSTFQNLIKYGRNLRRLFYLNFTIQCL